MKEISSRDNPLVKSLIRLGASSRERRRSAMTLLDGEHLLDTYAQAHIGEAEMVAISEQAMQRPALRRLAESVPAKERVVLRQGLFEQISQVVSPAGILALIRTPAPAPMPPSLDDAVLLEQIQDPGNLGSILRSAAAAGIRLVFLSRGSVFAWSPKVLRAGMGAHFSLDIHENADFPEIVSRAAGICVAADPRAGIEIYQADLRGPVVWMFGNEGAGLIEQTAHCADLRVRIPMPGPVESLNLAASVAICLFEQVRQRSTGTSR